MILGEVAILATQKPRSNYSAGLATRELILSEATQMMAECGYQGMTLRDLARRIGISHPAVIYHFPNKEYLVHEVIQCFEDKLGIINMGRDEEKDELVPYSVRPQSYYDYTVVLLRLAMSENVAQMLAFCAVMEWEPMNHDHPFYAYAKARRNLIRKFVIEETTKMRASGGWQFMVDPQFMADTLHTLWTGILFHARASENPTEIADSIIRFLATAVVLLKISPEELLNLAGQIPEDLAGTYIRVMRHVSTCLA